MKKLKVELEIELSEDTVKEELEEGGTEESIIKKVMKHVKETVGSSGREGWEFIKDVDVVSIGVS